LKRKRLTIMPIIFLFFFYSYLNMIQRNNVTYSIPFHILVKTEKLFADYVHEIFNLLENEDGLLNL